MGAKAGRVIRNKGMEIITAHLEARPAEPNALSFVGPGNLHPGGKAHRLVGNPASARAGGDGMMLVGMEVQPWKAGGTSSRLFFAV